MAQFPYSRQWMNSFSTEVLHQTLLLYDEYESVLPASFLINIAGEPRDSSDLELNICCNSYV